MAEIFIDPADVPEDTRGDFELIPDCEPLAQIISDELTVKDDGKRQRLVLCWEILDGPYAGRRIWDGLNIVNPSDMSQTIAKQAVIKLCAIHNVATPLRDSTLLHFKPTRIKVRTRPAKGDYGPQNEIKGYSPASAPAGSAPAASAPAAAAKPWRAKAA